MFRRYAGPVIHELFDLHRGKFEVSAWPRGDAEALSESERETVDTVLSAYGKLNGQQLSDKTHSERPWLDMRKGLSAGVGTDREISLEGMQDFFGGLANADTI